MSMKTVQVIFRITEKQMERLEKLAEREGTTANDMARTITLEGTRHREDNYQRRNKRSEV